ncbi:MAG: hypothetical protein AB7T06_33750 [Kofleriaceae bacterium]
MTGSGQTLDGMTKDLPIIGSAISGMESAYHMGAAVYDGVTGDRDGATAHGAKALMNAAMVVPGVNKVLGTADKVLGYGGTAAKIGTAVGGVDGEIVDAIPTGMDDVAAGAAVTLMNTFFGADEEKGTGTASGEMATGFGTMGAMMNAASGPAGMALAAYNMANMGSLYGEATEGKKAGTSGNDPGLFAKLGQSWHAGLFD